MSVNKKEHVSALVDDEVGLFESRRLVDEVLGNDAERARWARYHLIGEAMRGGLSKVVDSGFADRVKREIESEPALHVDHPVDFSRVHSRWMRPVAGFAMAASVAVVSVLALQSMMGPGQPGGTEGLVEAPVPISEDLQVVMEATPSGIESPTPAVALESPAAAPLPNVTVPEPLPPSAPSAPTDPRLTSYIVNHSEHAAAQGMMPRVRIVGYDTAGD